MPTQLGPKGDMRSRGVLSVIVNLPEMHIPPWYWFSWLAGLEIEAGRAWMGNAIYRDLVQALVMVDLDHLILAVPQARLYA